MATSRPLGHDPSAPDRSGIASQLVAGENPLLITPAREPAARNGDDFCTWLAAHRPWLDARLRTAGALLFRGFGIDTAARLDTFAHATSGTLRPYTEGQSQRARVTGLVYTSTEYPPDQDITLHNELSYTHDPPSRLNPRHLAHIRQLRWSQATRFDWEPGDALLLDNVLSAHGRTAFEGERRIFVAII